MKLYITENAALNVESIAETALNSIDEMLKDYPENHLFHVSLARQMLVKNMMDYLSKHTREEFEVRVG